MWVGDCADCVFSSLRGPDSNVAVRVRASSAFFHSCVFRDLIEADGVENIDPKRRRLPTGTFDIRANATLALSNCTLEDHNATIMVSRDARVYSNTDSHEVSFHLALSACL